MVIENGVRATILLGIQVRELAIKFALPRALTNSLYGRRPMAGGTRNLRDTFRVPNTSKKSLLMMCLFPVSGSTSLELPKKM